MRSYNHVSLIGRVTRNPEEKKYSEGVSRVTFTLAVDRKYQNPEGKFDVDFFRITAWNKLGELVTEHLKTGYLVMANGRLQVHEQTDERKARLVEIIADDFTLLSTKPEGEEVTANAA